MKNPPQKEKIILNVGRLVGAKGQKYLITAFSKLNHPDWKLIILGEGQLRQQLEAQVGYLNLRDRVLLPGSVKNVKEYLHRASIFAFPSISEGLPIALMEAMAAGLPCVSFDCKTGPSELINHGYNGLLVVERDIDSFSRNLQLLMEDAVLRSEIGNNAKQIANRYTVDQISKQILDFVGT